MSVTTDLTTLHRTVAELRDVVAAVRERYGDIPPVRRLLGDIERIDLDAADLDGLVPLAAPSPVNAGEIHFMDDTPPDPALWEGADDEGLGGYHR